MEKSVKNSKCIFYFSVINQIGGVESFLWYLANLYDIEVYYKEGDIKQLERLSTTIPIHKYRGGRIQCDKAFFNYNPDIIDMIDANEYIGIVHCDYKVIPFKPCLHPKIKKWVGVSQLVCDSFKEITGLDCELIYNPLFIKKDVEKPLIIVCACRLSKEKGKDNIIKLANRLTQKGKPYLIIVFTNDKDRKHEINNPNIVYADPQIDIAPYLKIADIVFVSSKTEAYGYTPVEATYLGIPVLLMDLPIWKELGFKDGVHGWIINDIDTFNLDKLWQKIPKFTYEPPKSNWDKYLPKKTEYNPSKKVNVRVVKVYFDVELNRNTKKDEILVVSLTRALYLEQLKLVEVL